MNAPISHRRGADLLARARELDSCDITIFMPCRNEKNNVGRALNEVVTTMVEYPYSYEIIIIDDASSDGSVEVIESFIAAHPAVRILFRRNPKPLGVSYNFMDAALLGRGQYFRMIGGHFQDRADAMRNGFDQLGNADIIITYMYPDKRVKHRQWISRTYTWCVNFISGYSVAHYHGTPIHRRMDVMRWHSYRSVGFYADMTTRLLDEGVTYLEVPTAAIERETGKSLALRWRNVISLLVGLSDMFLRRCSKDRIPPIKLEPKPFIRKSAT